VNPAAADVPVTGYIDGIQHTVVIDAYQHRPVIGSYVAAGAGTGAGELAGLCERLTVWCSHDDAVQVADRFAGSGLTVVSLACQDPATFSHVVAQAVSSLRSAAEVRLFRALSAAAPDGLLVVDGAIADVHSHRNVVGVVKSFNTRYLSDESCLWGLRPGWCSPVFSIDASARAHMSPNAEIAAGVAAALGDAAAPQVPSGDVQVLSCYVRAHSAASAGVGHGLVRVEALTGQLLEVAAALVWQGRQDERSGDPRWDRHAAPIAETERLLRTRVPIVFSAH